MSRIPIASLANGVLFATQSFASPSNPSGVPVLTPAVGTQCFVYIHDTATPAAIWTDELGSVPLAQPLTTSASGTVPGWIDTSLLPLDLIVALPSGNETFVLAGGGSGGGGGGSISSVFGRTGSITAQTGDYTAAQVGADAAGTAASEQSRAQTAEALLAPKASPALTGTPTAPTATALDNSTKIATTAYSDAAVAVEKTRALAAESLLAPKPSSSPSPVTAIFQAAGFGVKANGKCVTDAAISSGTSLLSSTSAAFTSADAGKLVSVIGAGAPASGVTASSIPLGTAGPTWTQGSAGWGALAASIRASGGTPTKIQDATLNSGTLNASHIATLALPGSVVAGHGLLLYVVGFNSVTGSTVTDNLGNTWTKITSSYGAGSPVELWYCASALAGTTTVTITASTWSLSTGAVGAYLAEWSNVGAVENVAATNGTGVTITPPNVAYSANDLVVVTELALGGPNTASPGAPWTDVGPTWFSKTGAQVAYQVPVAAGATNGAITAIPLTGAGLSNAVPSGAVKLTDGTHSQTFATPGAAAGATSLPVASQLPAFTFAGGSTVTTVNPPLQTTIASVAGGVATLAANASTTVSGAVCFYASDDTVAAQAAITAAQAVRGTVEFQDGFIGLSAPLVATSGIEIRGQSCKPLYGSFTRTTNAYNWPSVPPYLSGTVFWPFTAGTDCLQLGAVGESQDLRRFGIVFPGSNFNTGHGVNVTGMTLFSGHPDQGPADSDWDHVYVWGHDGSHYAFNVQNVLYPRWGKLRSWGGGFMHYFQTSTKGFNGNITALDCYGFLFNGGLAHGLFIDDQSMVLGGGAFDFSTFIRWQQWISADATGVIPNVLGPAGVAATPGNQKFISVSSTSGGAPIWTANGGQNGFIFVAPDFESSTGAQADTLGIYVASIANGVPVNEY